MDGYIPPTHLGQSLTENVDIDFRIEPDAPRDEVTFFPDKFARTKEQWSCTLDELAQNIRKEIAPDKASLPLLSLAIFGDQRSPKGSLRHNLNVRSRTGLTGDYDGGPTTFDQAVARIRAAGLQALLYETPSNSDASPHWRVVAPLSAPLEPAAHKGLMDRLNGAIGGGFAEESWRLSQSFYFGSIEGKPAIRVEVVEGDYIDLRPDIVSIPKPGNTVEGIEGGAWQREGNTWTRGDASYTVTGNHVDAIGAGKSYWYDFDSEFALADARRYMDGQKEQGQAIDNCFAHAGMLRDFGLSAEKSVEVLVEYGNDEDHAEARVNNAWEYGQNPPGEKVCNPACQLGKMLGLAYGERVAGQDGDTSADPARYRKKKSPYRALLAATPGPIRELIGGLVERNRVAYMAGTGGMNKSRVAAHWGLAVHAGLPIYGAPVEQAHFVHLSWENGFDEDARRAQVIADRLGIDRSIVETATHYDLQDEADPLAVISPSGITPSALWGEIVATLDAIEGHKFVVFDSLYNALHFTDQAKINESAVRECINWLDAQARAHDFTGLMLQHPSRAGANQGHAGYSEAWNNAPRVRLSITQEKEGGLYILTVEKRNNAAPGQKTPLKWDDGVLSPALEEHAARHADEGQQFMLRVLREIANIGPLGIRCKEQGILADELAEGMTNAQLSYTRDKAPTVGPDALRNWTETYAKNLKAVKNAASAVWSQPFRAVVNSRTRWFVPPARRDA